MFFARNCRLSFIASIKSEAPLGGSLALIKTVFISFTVSPKDRYFFTILIEEIFLGQIGLLLLQEH